MCPLCACFEHLLSALLLQRRGTRASATLLLWSPAHMDKLQLIPEELKLASTKHNRVHTRVKSPGAGLLTTLCHKSLRHLQTRPAQRIPVAAHSVATVVSLPAPSFGPTNHMYPSSINTDVLQEPVPANPTSQLLQMWSVFPQYFIAPWTWHLQSDQICWQS